LATIHQHHRQTGQDNGPIAQGEPFRNSRSKTKAGTTTPHHTTTVLRPFFRDQLGELVPEENFWTLWRKGRLTEADTLTIRLGATASGLTSAHLHHHPIN